MQRENCAFIRHFMLNFIAFTKTTFGTAEKSGKN
jgi:hypothetical protein